MNEPMRLHHGINRKNAKYSSVPTCEKVALALMPRFWTSKAWNRL